MPPLLLLPHPSQQQLPSLTSVPSVAWAEALNLLPLLLPHPAQQPPLLTSVPSVAWAEALNLPPLLLPTAGAEWGAECPPFPAPSAGCSAFHLHNGRQDSTYC